MKDVVDCLAVDVVSHPPQQSRECSACSIVSWTDHDTPHKLNVDVTMLGPTRLGQPGKVDLGDVIADLFQPIYTPTENR